MLAKNIADGQRSTCKSDGYVSESGPDESVKSVSNLQQLLYVQSKEEEYA